MVIFDFVGTIAFAIAGALKGVRKRLDIFGVIIVALATALGGGLVRDVIIGNIPPLALRNNLLVTTSVICALIVFWLHPKLQRFNMSIQLCDALGLGAFAVAGAEIAVQYGHGNLLTICFLAVVTAVGGGVLRDIFIQEIPEVFLREIYAVAALAGAIGYYIVYEWFGYGSGEMYVCFVITLGLRLIAIRYNLNLPTPRIK